MPRTLKSKMILETTDPYLYNYVSIQDGRSKLLEDFMIISCIMLLAAKVNVVFDRTGLRSELYMI